MSATAFRPLEEYRRYPVEEMRRRAPGASRERAAVTPGVARPFGTPGCAGTVFPL